MHFSVVLFLFVYSVDSLQDTRDLVLRSKRQLYLCGVQPYQYYSTNPCPTAGSCPNGGLFLNAPCQESAQCSAFYSGVSSCINGYCCSSPNSQNNPIPIITTTTTTRAPNGFVACGGQVALGSCDMTSRCSSQSQVCTSSNYCCECPYGRAYGTCGFGICPNGFTCQPNGNCCPVCPNNQTPFGTCVSGQCGGGRTCRSGNICC
ncbi:hypothetical protein B9Z55_016172 [Caenorhabditis nigoni]|uniref:CC domain-containing protein n=1 Tax=Caenorhabditis nigoni TaxID=1611254 RepID=A0A2G5UE14_9PELO|nr:hypothetical protein B9Z55_016172 [Caenorhabditis nigoni]